MNVGTGTSFIHNRPAATAAAAPEDPYVNQARLLEDAIYSSGRRAHWYGIIYYGSRFVIITLSACAAAKGIPYLVGHAALLSLLVAIGTTLDTWLQPSVKYKGHYTFNDKFRALRSDLDLIDHEDKAGIKLINEQRKAMEEEYRKTVLPL